jgi:putative peptidoglycan lipid II flippase
MIRRLISGKINSIAVAAVLVGTSSLVSRLLGVFRDRILAGEFGAGDTLDVYYAAFRVPDFIFNLLVLGALSAGFIPLFTSLIKCENKPCDNKEAWKFANNVMSLLGVFLLALSLIAIIFMPWLIKFIAPGFTGSKQEMTVSLTRIMFLSPLFLGLSSVVGGALQSFKRFFVYSLSPIFYNLGIILGALYLEPWIGAKGLAWGVVLGAVMHFFVQIPIAIKLGFSFKLSFNFLDSSVRRLGTMMIPRTLSLGIVQLNLLVVTMIASTLESGSLAVFNLANNLQSFPVGIFGLSFAVAAFPSFAASADKPRELVSHFSETFRQILFFIIPSSAMMLVLRAQITRVVLGTGSFNWHDTVRTFDALAFFSIGMFAQATVPILVRMFYARKDTKTPFLIGIFSVLAGILLALKLPKMIVCGDFFLGGEAQEGVCAPMGVAGLALAFSVIAVIDFIALWIALKIDLSELDEKRIIRSAGKFILASAIGGFVAQGMKYVVEPYADLHKTWGIIVQASLSAGLGLIVYFAVCALLKSEELFGFWSSIKRRMPWSKIEAEDQGEARGI